MAIYAPGRRNRHNKSKKAAGRKIVATLSLTAMVDMFTVLTIFLLQNYNSTGQVIHIPKEVVLPKATAVKELRPSHVVTVTNTEVTVDEKRVMSFDEVKKANWTLQPLLVELTEVIKIEKDKRTAGLKNKIKEAVGRSDDPDENLIKITVQADRNLDFLTLKKVMATVTDAGGEEINFAVTKKSQEEEL